MGIKQKSEETQIAESVQTEQSVQAVETEPRGEVIQEKVGRAEEMPDTVTTRVSRRRLLATGLAGGGALALGLSGFAFWKYQQRALQVIAHMDHGVTALAWSPDGRSFAVGDESCTVSVWRFNGQRLYHRGLRNRLAGAALAWSPDGRYLVVGGDGNAHIWHALSGESAAEYYFVDRSFAWSPDGRYIASGGKYGFIQVWEAATGQGVSSLQAYTGDVDTFLTVNSIAWAPDNAHIATVGANVGDLIALWDITTGKALRLPYDIQVKNPVASRMNAISWSPDGQHIAAGYADARKSGRVIFWTWQARSRSWEYSEALPAHAHEVNGIAWSPAGTRFASVGQDTRIQLWNMSAGLQKDISASSKGLGSSSTLVAISWSPDGRYLLTGDDTGQVLLWDIS
ncbi:MAG TPA: hypothetical protein VF458_19855 [Ktedonobacteraceae bacterium]